MPPGFLQALRETFHFFTGGIFKKPLEKNKWGNITLETPQGDYAVCRDVNFSFEGKLIMEFHPLVFRGARERIVLRLKIGDRIIGEPYDVDLNVIMGDTCRMDIVFTIRRLDHESIFVERLY